MQERIIQILGAGESGTGAALRLAKAKGYDVFVSDFWKVSMKQIKAKLTQAEIPFEEGKHSEDLILNAR